MSKGIARRIRRLDGWTGDAFLYAVTPPMVYREGGKVRARYDFVVVSATYASFSGHETYIFGASEDGEVLDWGELKGSYRGGRDHRLALQHAGYREVVEGG